MIEGCEELVRRIDAAVGSGSVEEITSTVKRVLCGSARVDGLRLPESLTAARPDRYARRLMHRDPRTGYTIVAMTWGPGQRTPLHDHAGIWCVECVLQGQMEIVQYDLVERRGGRFRFAAQQSVRAAVGDAGCLIPPYEYHVLANALPARSSVSLHVYGGEMDHCNVYVPAEAGWWERQDKQLTYDT